MCSPEWNNPHFPQGLPKIFADLEFHGMTALTTVSQSEWSERNKGYFERHLKAAERIDELGAQKKERFCTSKIIEGFIRDIGNRLLVLSEFDEKTWLAVIEKVTVDRDRFMVFRFRNGTEAAV